MGEQTKLDSGEMFRYSSYAVTETPIALCMGIMSFRIKGSRFLVPIPAFSLSQTSILH